MAHRCCPVTTVVSSTNGRVSPVTTVRHVAHARLLLAPTSASGTLTSRTVFTVGHVTHAWLLLVPTVVTGTLTSADRCYCWTRGIRTVAASAHSSD
jgi:hypothetical protein